MQASGFKSIQDTIGTLFLILLGEFDYEEMRKVRWHLPCISLAPPLHLPCTSLAPPDYEEMRKVHARAPTHCPIPPAPISAPTAAHTCPHLPLLALASTLASILPRNAQVHELWAILFFLFFVIFMFFIVLNIFLAILNDAYTVVHTDVVWDELEKRKPMSLREKFEVRKAIWRERKNIARMKKLKKEKVKAAKKLRKDYDKKTKDRSFLDKISRRNKREVGAAGGAEGGAGDAAKVRRTATAKDKPFS